jgi:hypothetical protein
VAAALVARHGLPSEAQAVTDRLAALEKRIAVARDFSDDATTAEEEAADALGAELLSRWPVLDDPWHPDFAETLARDGLAIREHLRRSPTAAAYQAARRRAGEGEDAYWELRVAAAPVERLARALETIALAERLRARGGADFAAFEALLACERGAP